MEPQAKKNINIKIEDELKNFVVPLAKEEFAQLEVNILDEGCRDPIILWKKGGNRHVIVDGHNRFKICSKYNLFFNTMILSFDNIEEAKNWMVDNQLGRRNLNKEQISFYRGLKYLKLRQKRGGYGNVVKKGDSESTADKLAEEFSVGESTIKRDAKFAEALELVALSNVKLRNKILRGDTNLKKADILMLSNAPNPQEIVIKNEADLFNQVNDLRNELLDTIEIEISKVEKSRLQESKAAVDEIEPIFLNRDDRIRKIKGMIISAMNSAISGKDLLAIEALKNLVESLQEVIFSE